MVSLPTCLEQRCHLNHFILFYVFKPAQLKSEDLQPWNPASRGGTGRIHIDAFAFAIASAAELESCSVSKTFHCSCLFGPLAFSSRPWCASLTTGDYANTFNYPDAGVAPPETSERVRY